MNGLPPGPPSAWKEVKTNEGKIYYHNTTTNKTSWEKPQELMTESERALVGTPWKEYLSNEKPYWHNIETGATTWTMPDIVTSNLNKLRENQVPQRPPAAPSGWAAGPSSYLPPQNQKHFDRDDYQPPERRDREAGYGIADRGPANFGSSSEIQFSSPEEAEAAFMKVLKKLGVQSDWSWPQAIRIGIRDSNWRAIGDPKEREDAFKKYCEELRAQDKAKEQDRQAKLRSDFTAMLRSHPEIKHYTRWKTALPMIESETIYRSAKDDTERRALFEEYIVSLKRAHTVQESEEKKSALEDLAALLQDLDLEPFTRWHTAEKKFEASEELNSEKFKSLSKVDVLETFEKHIKYLQRELNERVQADRKAKHREERKNRDAFKNLLNELRENGRLKAGTKWKDIHEYIHDDPRYIAMLGQHGSTPLDLFWDALEEEEGKFRTLRRYALEVLEYKRFEVTTSTLFEDFFEIMRTDPRTATIDEQSMQGIFAYVVGKVKKREEEERRDSEYHERRAMDDLRSVLKHLDPPVLATDSWETVRPRVEKSEEFRALKSESLRQSAFDKYIRRLEEKKKDRERDRSRRDPRDRDRDRRDRDREYRNGHSDSHRRHRTRTRSPEHDPYAAERRQAQQDREARYRNNDSTGLSPPYRRNRDDDRYERSRQGSGDHYGRERREREAERERSYVSRGGDPLNRADPRERDVGELDYGDSRPVSTRRRRDSDESADRRDSKRARYSPRRDRDRRSRTPAKEPELPKEDPGLRSGSEEGEIEED